jgi:hypothetical protein
LIEVAIESEQSKITQLLARFDRQKVPYGIAKQVEQGPKADFVLHWQPYN